MPKQGMKRPDTDFNKPPKNDVKPVPEIEGKAKMTKERAREKNRRGSGK